MSDTIYHADTEKELFFHTIYWTACLNGHFALHIYNSFRQCTAQLIESRSDSASSVVAVLKKRAQHLTGNVTNIAPLSINTHSKPVVHAVTLVSKLEYFPVGRRPHLFRHVLIYYISHVADRGQHHIRRPVALL